MRRPKIFLPSNLLAGYSWRFIVSQAGTALFLGILFLLFGRGIMQLLGVAIGVLLVTSGIQQFQVWYRLRIVMKGYWSRFIYALFLFLAGLALILFPLLGVFQLLFLLGLWSILHGIELLTAAYEHPRFRFAAGGAGLLSILFGTLLFVYPNAGLDFVNMLFAYYLIIYGIITLSVGLKLRAVSRRME